LEPWRKNYLTVWAALFTTSMGLMAFLPVLTIYVGERFGITDPVELTFWGSVVYGAAPLAAALRHGVGLHRRRTGHRRADREHAALSAGWR